MMKRNVFFIVGIAFLSIFYILSGCGGTVRNHQSQTIDSSVVDYIDPFSLDDEFTTLVPVSPNVEKNIMDQQNQVDSYWNISRDNEDPATGADSREDTRYDQADESGGYRIQIGIFADHNDAESVAQKARAVLTHKIYVVFEEPFYRVRVGDFHSKRAVENALKEVRQKGYQDAIWIRSEINE